MLAWGMALPGVSPAQVDTVWAPKRLFTINPISLIDAFGPASVRLGVEQQLSTDFSVAVEASAFKQYLFTGVGEDLQGAGLRLSTLFWLRRMPRYAKALSLDMVYKHTAGEARDTIKLDGVEPYRHSYQLDRRAMLVRLCFVEQRYWGKSWWTELYYGAGIRFKRAMATGITDAELDARDFSAGTDNDNYLIPFMHEVGAFIHPDLVIGVRFGLAPRTR